MHTGADAYTYCFLHYYSVKNHIIPLRFLFIFEHVYVRCIVSGYSFL